MSSSHMPGARKIGPKPGLRPDGTPDDDDRVETGPTELAFREWAERGLEAPNLGRMRAARLQRVVEQLQNHGHAGVLLFDPVNIRYATDCSGMQAWTARNPIRAAFVSADGHVILWDFARSEHLSRHLDAVDELRSGAGLFYWMVGDRERDEAARFAAELKSVLETHGDPGHLAVDRIELSGALALQRLGVELHSGQALMEHARAVKTPDEIKAMRCSVAATEIAVAKMREALSPGISELELWSILHEQVLLRGGELFETRLLCSGQRTNPWLQEAGPRRVEEGDLVAFDTDLVGPFGMCCDVSRTWRCGRGPARADQKELHRTAREHLEDNTALLRPGASFRELSTAGHRLPEAYRAQRYGVKMHGVGLADEFPCIAYPEDALEATSERHLEPGMVLSVEAYVGAERGREGVKLENQVLVTETGHEVLSPWPFDPALESA